MFTLEILLLGLALAIDAAVVTFTLGLLHLDLHLKTKSKRCLIISGIFGFFQFIMLWIGSYGGYLFTFSKYGHLFHLVVSSVFIIIGIKFFQESLKSEEERPLDWGILSILGLAVVTSIDALASGVSLGTLPHPHLIATYVGGVTFALCVVFYLISQFFKEIPDRWLLRFSSLIFFILGGKVFMSFWVKV